MQKEVEAAPEASVGSSPTPATKMRAQDYYRMVTFGKEAPDLVVMRTPYGAVELTKREIRGSRKAIAWMRKTYVKKKRPRS